MDYLTVKEIAELKGCSERYIRVQIKSGKLQAKKTTNTSNGHESYLEPVHIKRASKTIASMITERKRISSLS